MRARARVYACRVCSETCVLTCQHVEDLCSNIYIYIYIYIYIHIYMYFDNFVMEERERA